MRQSTKNSTHGSWNRASQRSDESDVSREQAVEWIHAHADRIEQRELQTALTKLEHHGSLTDAQRTIIVDMADTLVDELVTPPTQSLRNASSADRSDIRTALGLFDSDGLSDG